jgi:hypothetical protein
VSGGRIDGHCSPQLSMAGSKFPRTPRTGHTSIYLQMCLLRLGETLAFRSISVSPTPRIDQPVELVPDGPSPSPSP